MPSYDTVVSRRSVLSLTGAAGAAALAGCTGNGDEDGAQDPDQEIVDHADVYFQTADGEHQVTDFQYNPHIWGGYSHIQFAVYDSWAQYIIDNDEYVPHFVEEWEFDDGVARLHIRNDYTWGDGSSITADDLVMQLHLGEALGDDLYEFTDPEDIEAVDDTTVEIQYDEGTNREMLRHIILDRSLDHPPADWEDVYSDWQDGEDIDVFDVDIPDPTPSGPVDLGDVGEQTAQFDVRDDHPLAENYNFNGYEIGHRSGNEAFHQSFASQELDGVHSLFAGPGAQSQFPDTLEEVLIPGGFGMGIVFNHDHEHYQERAVRQAFGYAIDTEAAIATVGADTKQEFPVQSGLTVPATEDWLDVDEYKSYDQDLDMVETLLQGAGFERNDDDVWERDGSVLEAGLQGPQGWGDWVTPLSTIVDQLNQAGFEATLDSIDQGVWFENLATGDFGVAAYGHTEGGNAAMNYPFFSFSWKFENREHADPNFFNYPEDEAVTVPDGNGGEISVNPREELNTIANTNDDATIQESVERLARLFNEDLPMYLAQEKFEQSFIDRDGWEFPSQEESDHFQAFWPLYWLPKQDELKATSAAE